MRETTFEVERSFNPLCSQADNHVFVAGLPRSGTTSILNAIHKSNQFASLSYEDMPFILAPNLWSKLPNSKKNLELTERAHGDGIKIGVNSPEAFEEVFWMTFEENESSTKDKFRCYVELVNNKYGKERYLSKNNQNIRRLRYLANLFPNSFILIPFRNPTQQSYSLLSQHLRFLELQVSNPFVHHYMKLIGHTEFGPNYLPIYNENLKFEDRSDINHWMEQWLLTYQYCYTHLKDLHNIFFICYEELCSSNNYWADLLKILGLIDIYDYEFKQSSKVVPMKVNECIAEKAMSLYSTIQKASCLQTLAGNKHQ
jgi:hypothetical protein